MGELEIKKIYDYFKESLPERKNKIALVVDGICYTAPQFDHIIERLCLQLSLNDLQAGDKIALAIPNSALHGAILLAASKLDLTVLSFDPNTPHSALIKIASKNSPRVLILPTEKCSIEHCEYFSIFGADVINNRLEISEVPASAKSNTSLDESPYLLSTTSGSTGQPKPIAISQATKIIRANLAAKLYGLDESDVILLATPMHHTLAQRLFFMPMILGGVSVIMTKFSPENWVKIVNEQAVTFTMAVSTQLTRIASYFNSAESCLFESMSLKCLVASSTALQEDTKKVLLSALQCSIHEIYGASEVATVTDIDLRQEWSKRASVGRAVPDADVRILDDAQKDLAFGQVGEIAVRTRQVFSGYYEMPRLNHESFFEGYFLTQDMGYLDKDGYLYFVGRKKELIKIGGVSVYPYDIECAASAVEGVIEACCFGVSDKSLGEVPVLLVTATGDVKSVRRQLRRKLLDNLSHIQQPKYVEVVEVMHKTSTGKMDKKIMCDNFKKKHKG